MNVHKSEKSLSNFKTRSLCLCAISSIVLATVTLANLWAFCLIWAKTPVVGEIKCTLSFIL